MGYCNKCHNHSCRCSSRGIANNNATNRTINVPIPGATGDTGNQTVFLYTKTPIGAATPSIQQVPNPPGWSTQKPALGETEQLWETNGVLNYDKTVLVEAWKTPVSNVTGVESFAPEDSDNFFDI